jgi:hypothetical protein
MQNLATIAPVNGRPYRKRLNGITRRPGSAPFSNPRQQHSNFGIRNKITAEVWGPETPGGPKVRKARVERVGNVACTYGLDQMAQLFSSDTNGASKICSAMALGTDTTAANSTQVQLAGSTQIIYLSQASMVASYPGARTLQYNGTFASNGNACTVNEVGLFGTTNATTRMLARSVLGASSINRGTADEIRVSYQLIFGTA